MLPRLNENDILYIYKEQWFTGFAPCLFNNILSLACCKGNKINGGMRVSASKNFFENNKNVWILSFAGSDIQRMSHNMSKFIYTPGDALYLAKVTQVMSWKDYGIKFDYSDVEKEDAKGRRDAIYFCNKINDIVRRENLYHTGNSTDTDCATGLSNCHNVKQIILSDEYYIIKQGLRLDYQLPRNFAYNGINIKLLADAVEKHPEFFLYCYNPFNEAETSLNTKCGCLV